METPAPRAVAADDEAASTLSRALGLDELFPGFDAARLREVFPGGVLSEYPLGFRLVDQGEAGQDVFVIAGGKVSVRETMGDDDIPLVVLGTGDVFGEIGLLRGGVRTATATALEDSRIFRLPGKDLQEVIAKHPSLGDHLGRIAAARLGRSQ
ncbi:MAG: cyclic nucleotide-binding domain-containing protein [Elusimicrobia bacterium]|nr:cyclic nucleotide-binding domain-containing protein [Elusimicrobiota bacterium]